MRMMMMTNDHKQTKFGGPKYTVREGHISVIETRLGTTGRTSIEHIGTSSIFEASKQANGFRVKVRDRLQLHVHNRLVTSF